MNVQYWKRITCLMAVAFGAATPALAHRTDEYLQATKLTIGREDVLIEMSLTPGMDVAPLVFSWIDTNHDGRISDREGKVYAERVVHSLGLQVDDSTVPLAVSAEDFPVFARMREGVGAIHVRATGLLPRLAEGVHRVTYRNDHEPKWSVYLSNPLIPQDPDVKIVAQDRDRLQQELAVDYRLTSRPSGPHGWALWSVLTLVSSVALAFRFRTRNSREP